MIYLDYNATAPLHPAARAAWLAAQDDAWANPGSVHGLGQRARHAVDQAKAQLAQALGCAPEELVVTSGGSEANALAIHAALAGGGVGLAPAIEHSSVLRNIERCGSLRTLPVDGDGGISTGGLAAAAVGARLFAVQFANNELGTCHDVAACAAAARAAQPDIRVHCDAAQGPGKLPFTLRSLGVDTVAIAPHKFGAPKGVGLLWVRPGLTMPPQIAGGRQQQDRRSGTEDAPLVAAAAAALSAAVANVVTEAERQRALLDATFTAIARDLPAVVWIGRGAPRLPGVLNLGHPGARAEHLVVQLDLAGFAVSRGAACVAGKGLPSHVIQALGLPVSLAHSALRISIGPGSRPDELAAFVAAYVAAVRSSTAT